MIFSGTDDLAVLALAVLLDLVLGEPPTRFHPTVWMGRHISFVEQWAPKKDLIGLMAGLSIAITLPAIWGTEAYFLSFWLQDFHPIVYILVGAVLLKSTFSVRLLHKEAALVRGHLDRGDMEQVRARMPSLVSRDPSSLTAEQATAATVESVSENINDSFLAPWLFFALFGLPGSLRAPGQGVRQTGRLGEPDSGPPCWAPVGGCQRLPARPADVSGLEHHVAAPRPHPEPQRRLDHERHGWCLGSATSESGPRRWLHPGRTRPPHRAVGHQPRRPVHVPGWVVRPSDSARCSLRSRQHLLKAIQS